MALSDLTDEELMLEFQTTDNVAAFTLLVRKYKNQLMNFVHRFINDYELSADIVQDTMIRVFRNKGSFKPIGKFSTWIYTIAGNLAKTELQKKKRNRTISIDEMSELNEAPFEIADNRYRPDIITNNLMTEEIIMAAIQKIPDVYREILVLRDVQGLSYEEISEITGIAGGTVKSRLNRGRAQLQVMLKTLVKD